MTETLSLWQHVEIWLTAFVTIALFSFLYKDNPVYKFAEHIFAGLSAGYYVGLIAQSVVWSMLIDPLAASFTDNWLLLIPGGLGFLMFSRLTPIGPIPDVSWISRWGLALVVGVTAGIFIISQLHGLVMPQVRDTFVSLDPSQGTLKFMTALMSFVGVIATLVYFYFSAERRGALGGIAKMGIWFIMIAFGAQFGYTVMGRVSLLIGRLYFLIHDWLGASVGSLFR